MGRESAASTRSILSASCSKSARSWGGILILVTLVSTDVLFQYTLICSTVKRQCGRCRPAPVLQCPRALALPSPYALPCQERLKRERLSAGGCSSGLACPAAGAGQRILCGGRVCVGQRAAHSHRPIYPTRPSW